MKILITGAAGFIGSHLTKYCLQQGHEVIAVDNNPIQLMQLISSSRINDHVIHWRVLNVAKRPQLLEETFKSHKPDVCFHLAAYASEGRSNHIRSFIHSNNTVGTANVINACVNHNCKLVFTSSVAVYSGRPPFSESIDPNPIDEYGLSKYMSERSIEIAGETQGLDYFIVRPRNVYGPGQNIFDRSRNLFGIWCYNALNNLPLTIYGDGNNKREFTYIDDLIPSLYNAMDVKTGHRLVNLGSGVSYSIASACEAFMAVTGYTKRSFLETRHEVKEASCVTGLAYHVLGFREKTGLSEGLEKMWAWAQTVPMRELDKMPELEVTVNAHSSLK